ncbi:MAG: glucose dehydrogenase [Acidimicrobiia bacterium]|nr:glucose dehydrogenase [Acidimicrobiia bacterium]
MRRLLVVLGVVVASCAGGDGTPDLAPGATATTPTVPAPASVPATTVPEATTQPPVTPAPDVTTSTLPPSTSVPPTTTLPATTTLPPTTTTTEAPLGTLTGVGIEVLAQGLPTPVGVVAEPGTGRILAVVRDGYLEDVEGGTWFDITDRVLAGGERGLLGVAFHPGWPGVGRLFVHYTAGDGATTLSEFAAPGGVPDPASEQMLFQVGQPAGNHNGGPLLFLPDGTLVLALGDGGGANDQFGQGQRTDTALAALLRFDVSTPGVAATAAGNPGFAAPEVWAYGLRNPWQVTYDGGLLYIADVGQNRYEEVSVVAWDNAGVNFGWPITEGLHCFSPSSGCDDSGQALPVIEVEHGDEGTCSITGGVVYRGSDFPEWAGAYLFSDYCGGWLRSWTPDGGVVSWTGLVGRIGNVTGFGVDADGEVLVAVADGRIVRLQPER